MNVEVSNICDARVRKMFIANLMDWSYLVLFEAFKAIYMGSIFIHTLVTANQHQSNNGHKVMTCCSHPLLDLTHLC